MTLPLITAVEGFESVRNAVANILAAQSVLQQALATSAEEDPNLWKLNVYTELSNPINIFADEDNIDKMLVNVWYDSSATMNNQSSNVMQVTTSIINVDCIAAAITQETATGQTAGDREASERAQYVAKLCRRILMHPDFYNLGLSSIVRTRTMTNRTTMRIDENTSFHIGAVRLQFDVTHNETVDLETLSASEGALIKIKRSPTGEIQAQMDFDWS